MSLLSEMDTDLGRITLVYCALVYCTLYIVHKKLKNIVKFFQDFQPDLISR